MGNNENDLSDNIYEQLQKILNECIELWYINKKRPFDEFICTENYITNEVEFWLYDAHKIRKYSYHDLFSKDSGIMEFVERTNTNDWKVPEIDKFKIRWLFNANYPYETMWPMTAQEKIQYFISNAIVPNKK